MREGIAIVGLNGSGKSTLGHALAKELSYYEIDVEDYYFPEQKESRRAALDGEYGDNLFGILRTLHHHYSKSLASETGTII